MSVFGSGYDWSLLSKRIGHSFFKNRMYIKKEKIIFQILPKSLPSSISLVSHTFCWTRIVYNTLLTVCCVGLLLTAVVQLYVVDWWPAHACFLHAIGRCVLWTAVVRLSIVVRMFAVNCASLLLIAVVHKRAFALLTDVVRTSAVDCCCTHVCCCLGLHV